MIPEDAIRRLKSAVPLLPEVCARGIDLRKSGPHSWVGLCCFHRESTGSLTIHDAASRRSNVWFCFGCQQGGDVIDFVAQYEAVSRIQAIHRLAREHQIPLDFTRQSRPASRYLSDLREHADFWWMERRANLIGALEAAIADLLTAYDNGAPLREAKEWHATCYRLLRHIDSTTPEDRGRIFLRLRTEEDVRRWRSSMTTEGRLSDVIERRAAIDPDGFIRMIDGVIARIGAIHEVQWNAGSL